MRVKNCQHCSQSFDIYPEDQAVYTKFNVPEPTRCFDCRLQRKMQFRNERVMYNRQCSRCKTPIISIYSDDKPFTVLCEKCWSADTVPTPEEFGQTYDFTRPFFSQMGELVTTVPRQFLYQKLNENCHWVNRVEKSKNCYMDVGGTENEDSAYNTWSGFSKTSFDNYGLVKGDQCYETILCTGCYRTFYSTFCYGCRDTYVSENLVNCSNVIGCINLKNKNYHIFNQPVTPEVFAEEVEKLQNADYLEDFKKRFRAFANQIPHKPTFQSNAVDCSGDYIQNASNCFYTFATLELTDSRYVFGYGLAKECIDVFSGGQGAEMMYEYMEGGKKCYNVKFSRDCENCHDIEYSQELTGCSNCFGCVGLRHKQYCILNTQYTKEEYERLVPLIKQHMLDMPYTDTGGRVHAYGEFFPGDISPFAYNETVAQEYFPLTKESAQARGYAWKQPEVKTTQVTLSVADIPKTSAEAPAKLLQEVIECNHQSSCTENCTGVFKIVGPELTFLQQQGLPLPRLCPNCRHGQRLAAKNPLKLWTRTCMCTQTDVAHAHGSEVCTNTFETSYAPDRPERIYCIPCYEAEMV